MNRILLFSDLSSEKVIQFQIIKKIIKELVSELGSIIIKIFKWKDMMKEVIN